jgi:hypothetical protein
MAVYHMGCMLLLSMSNEYVNASKNLYGHRLSEPYRLRLSLLGCAPKTTNVAKWDQRHDTA